MKTKKQAANAKLKPHPIQLVNLGVKELFMRPNRPPDVTVTVDPKDCSIKVYSTPYDSKAKTIAVSLKLESGIEADKSKAPYAMKIELIGIFEVDEKQFPVEHVSEWAMTGAPFILFPYLREHAFGLSTRCGFKPLLLPLLEVPTFKIEKPKPPTKKKTK